MIHVAIVRNGIKEDGGHGQLVADGHVLLAGFADEGEAVTICRRDVLSAAGQGRVRLGQVGRVERGD